MSINDVNEFIEKIHQSSCEDDFRLREVLSVIWRKKIFVFSLAFVGALLSIFIAKSIENKYVSKVVVVSVKSSDSGGLSSLVNQFGGIASMAGIALPNVSGGDNTQLAIEILKSKAFLMSFIERHDILLDLMAAEKWNRERDSFSYDEDVYDVETSQWVRKVEPPFKPKPSLLEAYSEFKKIMRIKKDVENGTYSISIQFLSPYLAQKWATSLVEDLNLAMKLRDIEEAELNKRFLESELEKTSISKLQDILYSLIEEQVKTIMFANAREEYVFKVIDPAIVAEEKSSPNRPLIVVAGTIVSFVFAIFIILIRFFSEMSRFKSNGTKGE